MRSQVSGLQPATYTYDERGRLDGRQRRKWIRRSARVSSTYGTDGWLTSVRDPLGRTASATLRRCGANDRHVTLPGTGSVGFSYDANGNLTSLTPPGKTAHDFAYTSLDLQASYTPPSACRAAARQRVTPTTRTASSLAPPGGSARCVELTYDAAGRPASLTLPSGVLEPQLRHRGPTRRTQRAEADST